MLILAVPDALRIVHSFHALLSDAAGVLRWYCDAASSVYQHNTCLGATQLDAVVERGTQLDC